MDPCRASGRGAEVKLLGTTGSSLFLSFVPRALRHGISIFRMKQSSGITIFEATTHSETRVNSHLSGSVKLFLSIKTRHQRASGAATWMQQCRTDIRWCQMKGQRSISQQYIQGSSSGYHEYLDQEAMKHGNTLKRQLIFQVRLLIIIMVFILFLGGLNLMHPQKS